MDGVAIMIGGNCSYWFAPAAKEDCFLDSGETFVYESAHLRIGGTVYGATNQQRHGCDIAELTSKISGTANT